MVESQQFLDTIELDSISKQLLLALPDQVALLNENGDLVAHNSKWATLNNLVEEKWAFPLLGENVLQTLQNPLTKENDYALRFIVAYKSVLSGENDSLKVHFPISIDTKKWFSLTISALEDKKHFLLIIKDISAEMSAKSDFNESSVRFQKQFQNKLYGILIADADYKIIDANKTASKLLGISLQELKHRTLNYFLSVDLKKYVTEGASRSSENFLGESIISSNGSPMPVELSISEYTNYKGEQVYNCTFKDISDIKKAEQELQNSEKRYREQFENSLDGIILAEQNGKIFDINPAACSILGYTYDELMFHKTDILIDQNDQKIIDAINIRDRNQSYFGELEFVHKNGSKILVELKNRIFEAQDGINHSIVSFHDISEQARSKNIIEKQLHEKEVLIQEIHHRVKNNLAIISGLISLENIYSDDENLKKQLSVTQSRIHSIAKIHELLYENNDFSSIDFQEYVQDLTDTFSKSSTYNFTVISDTPLHLNVNQAVPCGMLLHEIATRITTKAKQQGFEKYNVQFRLSLVEDLFRIDICEQGDTKTFSFLEDHSNKLASKLISVLTKQLNGEIKLAGSSETCISISFKKRETKGAHSALV